ncbi:DUF962 domain-containing protein [Shewanella insulae]|uniref:DUF962 domain-containing protein n=1 Tax=Shewanella insulae TaxID=2681496 RepID=A0A6L7HV94_9GAMM|nr:DUF962 domain-containing protein [Shewanella insulae]MCG9714506.1 DUF962 domain-containing protein [Shewanella insulae]MCG9738673.1 DUF962 domain-containing protein [Shewanella insulae]MCG9753985.1 DUF962 domain-containing protein [Shewanella insulae]MXR68259.1 DUF962 domain-containing protein [Shewanella insulae]
MSKRYTSFKEFYPFYLSQHSDPRCRLLHYVGSLSVIALLVMAIVLGKHWLLWLLPVLGYGAAWIGHFVFERNRPATFEYPLYSFIADWVMLAQWLTGRR